MSPSQHPPPFLIRQFMRGKVCCRVAEVLTHPTVICFLVFMTFRMFSCGAACFRFPFEDFSVCLLPSSRFARLAFLGGGDAWLSETVAQHYLLTEAITIIFLMVLILFLLLYFYTIPTQFILRHSYFILTTLFLLRSYYSSSLILPFHSYFILINLLFPYPPFIPP